MTTFTTSHNHLQPQPTKEKKDKQTTTHHHETHNYIQN